MDLTRREVLKFIGFTALFSILPLGLQKIFSGGFTNMNVPGCGNMRASDIANIDLDAFLASCSRCGVCVSACPFDAIRYNSMMMPALTDETWSACPSTRRCQFCMTACPTDALFNAYRNFDKSGLAVNRIDGGGS